MNRNVKLYRGNYYEDRWVLCGSFDDENEAVRYAKKVLKSERFNLKYIYFILDKSDTMVLDYGSSFSDFFKYVYTNL